jgi:ubiquinone/menaquinone biosynthesis C-methylase UbiE
MRSTDWKERWDQSAQENQDIRLISGWGNRTFQEMLFSINDIAKKLDLQQGDRLLDIGCGAGLFEIAFAHWAGALYGADYSGEMAKIAFANTRQYDNVHIQQCDIKHLPFKNGYFDKILVNSVIQYLDTPEEIGTTMKELHRVIKTGGIIFLSLIPSASTKQDFLDGYYRLGLSADKVKRKIEINNNILWFFETELQSDLHKFGFSEIILAKPCDNFQRKYYFDLIIVK